MLEVLSIKNFAIIESISLTFDKGLTVLTGETGAGKSIIIDAIGLLVGARGSAEYVRYGAEKAEIEGQFRLESMDHPCHQKCAQIGIDTADDIVILRRDITANGKSVCRINGKLVTISTLREIGQTLIDIHGQHEHQELMNPDRHLPLLDQFGGDNISQALQEYEQTYKEFQQLKQKLAKLNENEQQIVHRLDLITFQLEEIKNAQLEPGEDEALQQEKIQLANYEKIFDSLQTSYNALSEENKGLDWIGLAVSELERIADTSEEIKNIYETIASSYYMLEEMKSELRSHLEQMEFDPERLHSVETRLNEIYYLKKKYGSTVNEILEYAAAIEDEFDTIQNKEEHIEQLEHKLRQIAEDLLVEAKHLSECRKLAAAALTEAIHQELKGLYMEKTTFHVKFQALPDEEDTINIPFFKNGIDQAHFYISTNPGEPLKPLEKVASGGELSRMMLALKSIFSKHQGVTSIIFDEVDTGVSGRVAQAIAEKMDKIATDSQVLCISHLPQVAAMADHHMFIAKEIIEERTKTSVTMLSGEERTKEIARMISGVEITEATKTHAQEMLAQAKAMKQAAIK